MMNATENFSSASSPTKLRPLSPKQERRLVVFLDNEFLELTRGYKKRFVTRSPIIHTKLYTRSSPASHLPTLDAYLQAAQRILGLILQVPPIDPSTSLRIQLLLRLTNEVLTCIPGYPSNSENLPIAMDWLDDLDQSWAAVLQAQVWNPSEGIGEDLIVDAGDVVRGVKSTPMSQTERTRLKSLLLGGVATLEEWLEGKPIGVNRQATAVEEEDGLNDIFSNTLEELGHLGLVAVEPEELCSMDLDDD
ncbi:uncharacterized protein C8R40DRAFT_465253 [Lentinula edodes]|uniref:uncharacterized protein n=1 Tax=Lentinula edodes TaxID=5353 RepID=UPI001E8CC73F|nr:uncharacterized protein C8R40DRAFT_465253 [Lentinula edodes]KAH7880090.1 hypothetical protein C8R40DRAFT_465253 [Lentinula edodes]